MLGKTKFLLILLGLSLALNVFFVGHYIGEKAGPEKRKFDGRHSFSFNMRRVGNYLTDEQKHAVRELLHSKRPMLNESFREMKKTEAQIKALVGAETVDTEALAALLDERMQKMAVVHEPLKMMMLEFIPTLDWETRKKIADEMFKFERRKKFRKHGGHPPRDGRHPPRRRDGDGEQDTPPTPEAFFF